VLSAVVKVLEESVAVRPQAPVDVISRALNDATPATANAVVVPPSVHPVVVVDIVISSVEPVPVVSTLP
jgi:hypothetical protein